MNRHPFGYLIALSGALFFALVVGSYANFSYVQQPANSPASGSTAPAKSPYVRLAYHPKCGGSLCACYCEMNGPNGQGMGWYSTMQGALNYKCQQGVVLTNCDSYCKTQEQYDAGTCECTEQECPWAAG